MIKKIELLVEGDSELAYCVGNGPFSAHFVGTSVFTYPRKHQTGWHKIGNKPAKGGILSWNKFVAELAVMVSDAYRRNTKIDSDENILVSTMFDLYGLEGHAAGLDYLELTSGCHSGHDKALRVEQRLLSDVIRESGLVESAVKSIFIPFCMVHEFEALYYCDIQVILSELAGTNPPSSVVKFVQTYSNANPEEVNDRPETAPSKRIIAAVPEYESLKKSWAIKVANKISVSLARQKMPAFNTWITKIESHFEI